MQIQCTNQCCLQKKSMRQLFLELLNHVFVLTRAMAKPP